MEASAQEPSIRRAYSDVAKTLLASSPPQSVQIPSSPYTTPSSTPQKISYRKTVQIPRRERTPLPESYDRRAHYDLIREPTLSLPDGCGLNKAHTLPNENLPELLVMLITNIIAKFSDVLPYDVAPLLVRLSEIVSNGPSGFNPNSS